MSMDIYSIRFICFGTVYTLFSINERVQYFQTKWPIQIIIVAAKEMRPPTQYNALSKYIIIGISSRYHVSVHRHHLSLRFWNVNVNTLSLNFYYSLDELGQWCRTHQAPSPSLMKFIFKSDFPINHPIVANMSCISHTVSPTKQSQPVPVGSWRLIPLNCRRFDRHTLDSGDN